MLANRIYCLFLSLILFFSIPLQSSETSLTNDTYTQEWVSLYLENMNPQELQIVANFLYVVYANAIIDVEIQKYYSPFSLITQNVHINLSDPNNSNKELVQLKKVIEKLTTLVQVRFMYTNMLNNYLSYYNADKIDAVDQALKTLQVHASDMLYKWADETHEDFANHLEKAANIMDQCQESMRFASGLFKSLHDGKLPFVVEEKDKSLAIINLILRSTPMFMNTANTATNLLNVMSDHAMQTICFGAQVYKDYYQAVHNLIMQEDFDKNYATTLFVTDDLVLAEYQTLLPDVNNVAMHMLETQRLMHDGE
jgi:hypothetical protein